MSVIITNVDLSTGVITYNSSIGVDAVTMFSDNNNSSSPNGPPFTLVVGEGLTITREIGSSISFRFISMTGAILSDIYHFNGDSPSPAPSPSPSPTPSPTPVPGSSSAVNTPVIVNLAVEVDASGNINIFGQEVASVSNVIIAEQTLPVVGLYDVANASSASVASGAPNSMFEFWEPSADRGTRAATLSGKYASGESVTPSGGRNYKLLTRKLVKDIQAVLEDQFNVTTASPFNLAKYDNVESYRNVTSFGELALRTFSHYLLGHIDATSAITNDVAFVRAMLSQNVDTGVYKGVNDALYAVDEMTGKSGSNSDANLAELLVQTIVSKNDTGILAIAEQVLGQDASRAMDQDNNIAAPDVRQALKFIAGDVIYMNIKLLQPDVTMGLGQKVTDLTVEGKYVTEENYTLKITLA